MFRGTLDINKNNGMKVFFCVEYVKKRIRAIAIAEHIKNYVPKCAGLNIFYLTIQKLQLFSNAVKSYGINILNIFGNFQITES